MKAAIGEYHQKVVQQLKLQKESIEAELANFVIEVEAEQDQAQANEVEELLEELKKFQANQQRFKETVCRLVETGPAVHGRVKKEAGCQISTEVESKLSQTLLEQKSTAC